jgi:hypothetical protein
MMESFKVAFLAMTAMSLIGVVLAIFIRDPRWEAHRFGEEHETSDLLAVEVD